MVLKARAGIFCLSIRFEEAGNFMKRELDFYSRVDSQGLLNKLVMGLVLVHLHREDHTAADQAFQACLR
jgi:hypothetical protein